MGQKKKKIIMGQSALWVLKNTKFSWFSNIQLLLCFTDFWNTVPTLDPLNLHKMLLKNLILPCLESSLSKIVGKKVETFSFFLFLKVLLRFKNATSFKILKKKMHFAPFSTGYYFLIGFSKTLQFTFSYS